MVTALQLAPLMPLVELPSRVSAGKLTGLTPVVGDAAVLTGALLLAYGLRFDFSVPAEHWGTALLILPLVVAVQCAALALAGVYSGAHRGIDAAALKSFALAAGMATLPLALLRLDPLGALGAAESLHMPFAVIVLDALLGFSGVLALRAGRINGSADRQTPPTAANTRPTGRRVLLIGAGQAAAAAIQTMRQAGETTLCPIGLIDLEPGKIGHKVEGLHVYGRLAELPQLVRWLAIDQVLITLDSASRREIRRIVEHCERIPVKVRVVPCLLDLIEGKVETTVPAVDIEALLGREPVALEQDQLLAFLAGKRVLVTGAGGSIGSELCRQIARFAPASLVLVERCEFALWSIERDLQAAAPGLDLRPRLADVGDRSRMRDIFARERPQVVLHAAAHKHVPLVESNPCEAIKNNIFGTRTTGELAGEFGVETFVLISTDKAVRPTSMMGATKRIAELVVQRLNARHATNYIAVRFGNVLGSTGSVVPIFRDQIARGGPITITHPDMVRFFMTIPEAAQLVLQAGALQAGGEIYVLDMGEPVRIVDLATTMIAQCGLKPDDIEIVFNGIRPGEKLYEELSTDDEALARTRHPKILSGTLWDQRPELDRDLDALTVIAERGDEASARRHLARMLPESRLTLLAGAPAVLPTMNETMNAA